MKRIPELVFHTNDPQLADAVVASINAEYPGIGLEPTVREIPRQQPKYSVGVMVWEGQPDVTRNLLYFCRGVERGWHQTFVAIRIAAERLEKAKAAGRL